jgi:hypothetical protein
MLASLHLPSTGGLASPCHYDADPLLDSHFHRSAPEPAPLARIYAMLGLDIPLCGALRPGFVLMFDTPRGRYGVTK